MKIINYIVLAIVLSCPAISGYAEMITYNFTGTITSVTTNTNNTIPNLDVGDTFSGYTSFESTGWNGSNGTVYVSLNGVDLLFTGPSIYGGVALTPNSYSLRIAGDAAGDITGSTFSAFNFGPDLIDSNGSAGITELFPESLNLQEFETNIFRIMGTYPSDPSIGLNAVGRLDSFTVAVPEPSCVLALLSGLTVYSVKRMRTMRRQRACC
jgi:hypothetical protein